MKIPTFSFEISKFKFGRFSISYDKWDMGKVVGAFFEEIGLTGILNIWLNFPLKI